MNRTPLILAFLSHATCALAMISPSSPSSQHPSPAISAMPSSVASPETSPPTREGPEEVNSESKTTDKPHHSYRSVSVSEPYIAITFDDGPHGTLTPKLLDMLKERGIKATFFLIGQNAQQYPDIVQRIHNEGHEIANHSWSHPALNKCSPEKFRREIEDTNAAIKAAIGVNPTLIRPPYGATNASLDRTLDEKYGMKVILWSVDPMDWKYRHSERVANYILKHAKPGDIILSHDIHPTTVAAMPTIFDTLLARGFKFVTVSQLLALQTAAPPKASASPTSSPSATY